MYGQKAAQGGPKVLYGGSDPGMLTGAALDQAANVYNRTGQMPQGLGRNGVTQRAILDRAAQLAGGESTNDLLTGRAGFKADAHSLQQLTTQADRVLSFERTAVANGRLAQQMADQAHIGGTPLFNSWVNAGRRSLQGDPAISAFDVAVQTFANEYAAVTSSAGANAPSTDSAKAHANAMINSAQTPQQFRHVMNVLYQDMENRKKGLHEQIAEIQGRLHGGPPQDGQQLTPTIRRIK